MVDRLEATMRKGLIGLVAVIVGGCQPAIYNGYQVLSQPLKNTNLVGAYPYGSNGWQGGVNGIKIGSLDTIADQRSTNFSAQFLVPLAHAFAGAGLVLSQNDNLQLTGTALLQVDPSQSDYLPAVDGGKFVINAL
jgi:hypothetical protein